MMSLQQGTGNFGSVQDLSRAGLFSAFLFLLLLSGRYFPIGHKFVGLLCSLTILVAIILLGVRKAALIFGATAVLANLLAPSHASILYLCAFGSYPFVKILIDQRLPSLQKALVVKLVYFCLCWALVQVLLESLFFAGPFGRNPNFFFQVSRMIFRIWNLLSFVVLGFLGDLALSYGTPPLYSWLRRQGFLS